MLDCCIESARKTNAMNMQGITRKQLANVLEIGVVSRAKGHLDLDLSAQNVKAPYSAAGVFPAAIRRPGQIHAFHTAKSFDHMLRKTATCSRAACNVSEQHYQQRSLASRREVSQQ